MRGKRDPVLKTEKPPEEQTSYSGAVLASLLRPPALVFAPAHCAAVEIFQLFTHAYATSLANVAQRAV